MTADARQILIVTWIAICVSFMLGLFMVILFQIAFKSSEIMLFFKATSMISMLALIASSIADIWHIHIADNLNVASSSTLDLAVIIVFANSIYFIGTLFLYLYILGKLYFTFQDTIYQFSKRTIIFILSLIFILCLAMAGYLYTIATNDTNDFYRKSTPFVIVLIVIDLFVDTVMLVLFVQVKW